MSDISKLTPEDARRILSENDIPWDKPKESNRSTAGEIARGLASGAASLADPLALVANLPTYAANAALGTQAEAPVHYPSELVRSGLEKLSGVQGEPTTAQKVIGTGTSFIGGGLGGKAALAARRVIGIPANGGMIERFTPKTSKEWLQLGGAGLGAGAGEQISDEPAGKIIGGTLGATLGGGLTKLATDFATVKRGSAKQIGRATRFSPEKYEKFKEAGITPSLGEISTSKVIKNVQNLFSELPGSGGVMERAGIRRTEELENLKAKHLNPDKIQELDSAGEIVKQGAKAFNQEAKDSVGVLYDKAFQKFKDSEAIPLDNTQNVIQESFKAFSPEGSKILKASAGGKKLLELESAIKKNKGSLPYYDLKYIFKPTINDLIDSFGQVGSSDQGKLKRVAETLTNDMRAHAQKVDPASAAYLEVADQFWANFSKESRGITNKLISHQNPITSFNDVFNNLKRGNIRPATIVFKKLSPEQKEELSTTFIDELGLNREKQFDFPTFSNNFSKLRPTSKAALLSGLPEQNAKKIRVIADALQETRGVKLEGNPSRTSYSLAIAAIIKNVIKALPGLGVSYMGAKKFTDPKFLNALYDVAKNQSPAKRQSNFNYYSNLLIGEAKNIEKKHKKEDNHNPNITPEEARRILKENNISW